MPWATRRSRRAIGRRPGGLLLNVEVDDVDAVHAELESRADLDIVLPLRSEDFGQRHFILAAPDDVLIDIIQPIEPTSEFAELYIAS